MITIQPQALNKNLDELFELDDGTVSSDDVLQNIDGWSSLTFVGLIAMIDDEYGVTVAPTTILACKTVADLQTAIEEQLGKQ